jgi:hypothetical protein
VTERTGHVPGLWERKLFGAWFTFWNPDTWAWPSLCSSGQSSWLQIQIDSRRYQIFWEVVGMERRPLSLVTTTEELFDRKSSGSGLEIREYGHRDPSRWPRGTLYQQKLALTSPRSGGRSVGIVCLRTQATEFSFRHMSLPLRASELTYVLKFYVLLARIVISRWVGIAQSV